MAIQSNKVTQQRMALADPGRASMRYATKNIKTTISHNLSHPLSRTDQPICQPSQCSVVECVPNRMDVVDHVIRTVSMTEDDRRRITGATCNKICGWLDL